MASKSIAVDAPVLRAAMYVRMSTDPQNYSIQHQCEKLNEYAAAHGMQIVAMYADAGKSGLRINGRDGMKNLLDDVLGGMADFNTILVYDVSRWGRFQDVDESAHYEFLCRRAGIDIVYCAESFQNDGSAMSSILKNLKRTMAAEYSRELSRKVFSAQSRFALMGFKQGGSAGYALRRAVVDKDGRVRRLLRAGERKGALTNRVVFVPGPAHEVAVLRRIYDLYLHHRMGDAAIASLLNNEQIPSESGRPWTAPVVHTILTHEKYAGSVVYNRTSYAMHTPPSQNPPETWVLKRDAFEALVPFSTFQAAQQERQTRGQRIATQELLEMLRLVHQMHGEVSTRLIDLTPGLPPHKVFVTRFGTLTNAYALAGVRPTTRAEKYVDSWRRIETMRNAAMASLASLILQAGSTSSAAQGKNTISINGSVIVKLIVARSRRYHAGRPLRWQVDMTSTQKVDFVIAVQLDAENNTPAAYFLFPAALIGLEKLTICEESPQRVEAYRHANLESMFGLSQSTI
ncbi:recombinase family protein [Oxalobacteraceae bacterium OTU3CAMAD1]|nr:recombinase family protein [Oxalobacteraceae bacterium OTU3CAMAD1]